MGKYVNFCTQSSIIAGLLSVFFITVNTENSVHDNHNADVMNGEATTPELTRFFKTENEETWLISDVGENGKCLSNMINYSTVTAHRGGVIYLSVIITKKNLFTSQLENSSSSQYQQLSYAVEEKVNSFFKNEFSSSSLVSAKVIQFRKGSIIADLKLEFDDKDDDHEMIIRKKRAANNNGSSSSSTPQFITSTTPSVTEFNENSKSPTIFSTTGSPPGSHVSSSHLITPKATAYTYLLTTKSSPNQTTKLHSTYLSVPHTTDTILKRNSLPLSSIRPSNKITISTESVAQTVIGSATTEINMTLTNTSFFKTGFTTYNKQKLSSTRYLNLSSFSTDFKQTSSMQKSVPTIFATTHLSRTRSKSATDRTSTLYQENTNLSPSFISNNSFTIPLLVVTSIFSNYTSAPLTPNSTIFPTLHGSTRMLNTSYLTTSSQGYFGSKSSSVNELDQNTSPVFNETFYLGISYTLHRTLETSSASSFLFPSTRNYSFSSQSTISRTQKLSNLSASMIASKFISVGNSLVNTPTTNMASTLSLLLPSTSRHNFSSLSTMTQTVSYLSASMIATSSKFINVENPSVDVSSLIMSSTSSLLVPSTRGQNFSSLSTMNQTVSIFSASMIVTSSKFFSVRDSTVNKFNTPPLMSPSKGSLNFSSQSTVNQTQTVSFLSTSMTETSSKFVSVGNSTVTMSNVNISSTTPLLLSSITSRNIFSQSTVNQTQTVSYLSTSMIETSSKFVGVRNSSVTMSRVNIPSTTPVLLSSTRSSNFSKQSTVNQTPRIFSTSMNVTSSKFLSVRNSSMNVSNVPPSHLPSSKSPNFSSQLTMNQTQAGSKLSTSMITTSSKFLSVGTSLENTSNTSLLQLPSTRSPNFSLLSTMNQTQIISIFSTIATSSMLVSAGNSSMNKSNTPSPIFLSARSRNFSSPLTVNQTVSILSASTIATSSMFVSVGTSMVNMFNTSPHLLPSTKSHNFFSPSAMNQTQTPSILVSVRNSSVNTSNTSTRSRNFSFQSTMNQTITLSIFSTSMIATLSKSVDVGNSTVNISNTLPLLFSSTRSHNFSSPSTMNQTQASIDMITSPSTFLGEQNSSVYTSHTPTLVLPSTTSRNLSSVATMNNTGIIPTFATSMRTSSTMLLRRVENSSIYHSSTSTVQSLTLPSISATSSRSAGNETATMPLATMNKTFISTSRVSVTSTITAYSTNISSSHPTQSSVHSGLINATLLTTLSVLPSVVTTSMINSSLTEIVASLTQNYSAYFTSHISESKIYLNTSHLLTISSNGSTVSQFSPSMFISSTILDNITLTYSALSFTTIRLIWNVSSSDTSQLASFKVNASSLISTASSISTRAIYTTTSSLPVLSSTHSDSTNYSISPSKMQVFNQTIQPSFPTNVTESASEFSFHAINSSTMDFNKTNQTSKISTTLVNMRNISTKAIQPTSQISSTPATSTIRVPIALSKQRIVSGNFTIVNWKFTRQLFSSSSKEYIEMVQVVKPLLVSVLQDTPGFIDVEIRGFRNGSVLTIFHIVLESSSNVTTQELENVIFAITNAPNLTITNVFIEELCTSGFCSSHGTCTKISNTQLQCSCNSGYGGPRCSSKVTGPNDDDDGDDFEEYWIAIGVCLGLFVLIIILLIFLALRRRRKYYVTRESVMSIGRTSGDVFFNPAYGHSREHMAGKDESSNVIPLEVVYENSSSSFKNDTYQESEFMSNEKPPDEDEDEDIYKTQLLLFLKQNNLLKNSSADTQKPSWASSRSSVTTNDSDSGL